MKKNREMFMANDVRICQMSNHLITICSASHLWPKIQSATIASQKTKVTPFFVATAAQKKAVSPRVGPNLLGSRAFGVCTGSRGARNVKRRCQAPKWTGFLAKLWYFTNPDFPERRMISLTKSHHLGVLGRVRLRWNLTRQDAKPQVPRPTN